MDKYLRNYKLFIEEGQRTFEQVSAGVPAGAMIEVTLPFTIEFDVTRKTLSSANTSSFRIYNLAETTRKKIFKDRYASNVYKGIELKAGYGNNIPTIFKGNIKQAWSVREGVNFITQAESYDGGFAFINGQTSQAYQAGTPQNAVLDAIVKTLPAVNPGAIGEYGGALPRGNSLNGNSVELLQRMTNNGFFIDNEKAYCLNDNECIRGSLLEIDSDSGLLSTPVREETILTFDMLFEPRLLIGQEVQLKSSTERNFNGSYKVISLHHRGMISDSVCGNAVTSVGLWYGTQLLKLIN